MAEKRGAATVAIEGVALHLAHPDELPIRWVGQAETLKQLLAAWSVVDDGSWRAPSSSIR